MYDELIVSCEGKYNFCLENNMDIMIDNEPQNINEISESLPVIVFEDEHNKVCEGENIIKINNWN